MKKRALTILLCATLILSLVACGGGQSGSNSTEPPSNSTGGTQQNDEPTTPPPSESNKTPDTTEPQDTETTEPSTSDAPVDDVPLYLGGNKEVSPEDFVSVYGDSGLIEFDNAAVVKDVALNINAVSFWGLAHPFTITLGTNSTTLGEFLEQYNMANADGTFGDACSTAEDLISNVFDSIWFKYNANTDINNESTTLDDCEALRIFVIDNEGDFGTINGAPIDDNTSSDWRYEKDATDLVNLFGVPKYGCYEQTAGSFSGYVWDADEFWLCFGKGYITYIRKGLGITELGDFSKDRISVMLTEIQ